MTSNRTAQDSRRVKHTPHREVHLVHSEYFKLTMQDTLNHRYQYEEQVGVVSRPAAPKTLPVTGRMRSYSQLKGPRLYFSKGSSQMTWFSTLEISLPLHISRTLFMDR